MSDVLTIEAVAERLSCHPRTIRRAIERGDLRASDIGSGDRASWRIREDDLEAWLEAKANRPRPSEPSADVAQLAIGAARPRAPRRAAGRLQVPSGMGRA